jgi:hypothetical protein
LVKSRSFSKKSLVATVLLVIVLIVAVAFISPQLGGPLTLVGISQYSVQSGGSAQSSTSGAASWTGAYWSLTFAVTQVDQVTGYELPANTSTVAVDNTGKQYTVYSGADLVITITPQQPYLQRTIKADAVLVTPTTYRTWSSTVGIPSGVHSAPGEADAQALYITKYSWATSSWTVHTPFTVEIKKNGVVIGSQVLDNGGASDIATVALNDGSGKSIRIENLGLLGGQYTSPDFPSDICFLNGNKDYVYDWGQIAQYVVYDSGASTTQELSKQQNGGLSICSVSGSNAYSVYWYGNQRWGADTYASSPPAGVYVNSVGGTFVDSTDYGGWKNTASDTWTTRSDPVAPVVFSSDKALGNGQDADARSKMCLTEYLQSKSVTNFASAFQSFGSGYTVDTTNNVVTLNIPWSAYGTPLVNVLVPTETVNTWVYNPQISNVQLSGTWQSTGTVNNDNLGSSGDSIILHCIQTSSVTSSAKIVVTTSVPQVGVFPTSQTITLAPGASQTVSLAITNTGVTSDTKFSITITAYEMWTNTATSTVTLTGTLKALVYNSTYLRIHVIDSNSSTGQYGVAGIDVQIQYPPGTGQTGSAFTDSTGVIQWTLPPTGSAYTGQVYIQTMGTDIYNATYTTVTVGVGENDVIIDLTATALSPAPWWMEWWVWAIAIAVVVAIVTAAMAIRRRGRHGRRR